MSGAQGERSSRPLLARALRGAPRDVPLRSPVAAAALVCLVSACGHVSRLDARVSQLSELARKARAAGAYHCAPEELAQAEAQLEFAQHELREGDQPRAREHLTLAQANVSAALRLSAPDACSAPRSYAPEAVRNEASVITARLPSLRGSTKEHAAI